MGLTGTGAAIRSETVASALVTAVEADSTWALDSLDGPTLRCACLAVAVFAREAAIACSAIVPAGRRLPLGEARAIRLLERLADAAFTRGDFALGAVTDWFAKAWLGRPFNGSFYDSGHLPEPVYLALAAAVDGHEASPYMIGVVTRLRLESLLAALVDEASRLRPSSPEIADSLLRGPLADIAHAARAGRVEDGGLLSTGAESLLTAMNHHIDKPVPDNGKRWPVLVRAIERIQDHVRNVVALAALPMSDEVAIPRNDSGLGDDLGTLVEIACTGRRPDREGEPWAGAIAAAALAVAGDDELRCRIAGLVDGLDIAGVDVDRALSVLHGLHDQLVGTVASCPDDPEVEEVAGLVSDAIADYDVASAREALDLLATTVRRTVLSRRIVELEREAMALPAAGSDLRAAQAAVAEGRLEDAEFHLDRLAGSAVVPSRPAPAAERPAAATPPMPNDLRHRRDAVEVDPATDAVDRADAAGNRPGLRSALIQLAEAGSGPAVNRMLERYAGDQELVDALASGLNPRQRPAAWHELARIVRERGDPERADELIRRSRPPMPPDGLTAGAPLPGADLLQPVALPEQADVTAELVYAAREGNAISFQRAIARHVAIGDPLAALDLFRECFDRFYGSAALAWNVACAYARIGARAQAMASLRFFMEVAPVSLRPEQSQSLAEFLHANGEAPPAMWRGSIAAIPAAARNDGEAEQAAKEIYERGDVDEAFRRVRLLVRSTPNSPGWSLLLRICREQGWLAPAEEAVAELAAGGAVRWQHYIELARVALAAGRADVAMGHVQAASGLEAPVADLLRVREQIAASGLVVAPDRRGDAAALTTQVNLRARVREAIERGYLPGLVALIQEVATYSADDARIIVDEIAAAPAGARLIHQVCQAMPAEGQLLALLNLAPAVAEAGAASDAIAMFRSMEELSRPNDLPRLWLALRQLMVGVGIDPDREEGHWFRLPAQLTPTRGDGAGFAPPPWIHVLVGTVARQPVIQHAQQVQLERGPGVAALLWRDAVDAGHGIALPNALGCLVIAGQPEEAIALYRRNSERMYVVASAAWNLGCACAHIGDLEAAAAAFDYHARVTSRTYQPDQRIALERLFGSLGRPVPVPAITGQPAAVQPPPAHPVDAPAAAPTRMLPAVHRFVLASAAKRAEMAAETGSEPRVLLAQIERMFAALPERTPHTVAELARARAAAGEGERAWELMASSLTEFDCAAQLLSPAFILATELGHVAEFEEVLMRHADDGDYTQYLTLAKLAAARGDNVAKRRFAEAALRKNPSSVEASKLSTEGLTKIGRPIFQQSVRLRSIIQKLKAREPASLLAALPDYGREVERLRDTAIDALSPSIGDEVSAGLPASRAAVEAAIRAAQQEDWSLAAAEFQAALQAEPRNTEIARAAASALLLLDRIDEARAIAESISYSADGKHVLAQIAYREEDFDTVTRLLTQLGGVADVGASGYPFALAGVLLHMRGLPKSAARVLIDCADDVLPGEPQFAAALAAFIAAESDEPDLVKEAADLVFQPTMDSAAAVSWAIGRNRMAPLRASHAPDLAARDLRRLVEHFEETDPTGLVDFLGELAGAQGIGVDYRMALYQELAGVAERSGLLKEAFEAREWLIDRAKEKDRARLIGELMAFCRRTGFVAGAERVLQIKQEFGLAEAADEREFATSQRGAAASRESTFGRDVKVIVYEIDRLDVDVPTPALAALLDTLVTDLRGLTEQTATADVVERLATRWRRNLQLLPLVAGKDVDQGHRDELIENIEQVKALENGLGNDLVEAAARSVNKHLYRRWEQIARAQRTVAIALEIEEVSATRIAGGPTEIVLALAAHAELTAVSFRISTYLGSVQTTAGEPVFLGSMQPGQHRQVGMSVVSDADEVSLTVAFAVDGLDDEIERTTPITVSEAPETGIDNRFTPDVPPRPEMFVGRGDKLKQLRFNYGQAHMGSSRILSLTGPRKIGKSSLLKWLGAAGAPAQWRIPYVCPVYLDVSAEDGTRDPLHNIVAAIVEQARFLVAEGILDSVPEPPAVISYISVMAWCKRLREACQPRIGFLVILDEVQELLKRLEPRDFVAPFAGALRTLNSDGAFAVLLCGSCTGATMKALLPPTHPLRAELHDDTLGYLDQTSTELVFEEGFAGQARVLPEAKEEIWRLTEGHPNHIHHMGRKIVEQLMDLCRQVVTKDLVTAAGYAVAASSHATTGMVDLDEEGPDGRDLIIQLAGQSEFDNDLGKEADLRRDLGSRHRDQLERYTLVGLLRVVDERYRWANEIIYQHVQDFAKRQASQARRRSDLTQSHLHDRGFTTEYAHPDGRTLRVTRAGQPFTAKRLMPRGTSDETLEVVTEHLLRLSRQPIRGVPQFVCRAGEWFVSEYAQGLSLAEITIMKRERPYPAHEIVGWIAHACDVVAAVFDQTGITHGNIGPGNIIVETLADDECSVRVVDWGSGTCDGKANPASGGMPGYMSPAYLRRLARDEGGARPTDDVFALGVVLYQMLSRDERFPYGPDLADMDVTTVLLGMPPLPIDDPRLLVVLNRAIALRDEDRYTTPAQFGRALRDAVPARGRHSGP